MDSAVLLAVVVKPTRSEQLVSASDPNPDPSHDGHYLLEQTNVFLPLIHAATTPTLPII